MEIRAAKAHERDEIVDLISAVFVEKCRPRYASQHYQDSSYELDQSRVCVVDGKIVSYVRVSNRSMYIGEAVVKLGGIGMVVTSEEYRRRGYSSTLLRDAIAYMEAQNYDLSLLFTTIQPFYMPLGWAAFPQTSFELELHDKKTFAPSGWKSRRFDLERDLDTNQPNLRRTQHRTHRNNSAPGKIVVGWLFAAGRHVAVTCHRKGWANRCLRQSRVSRR